MSDTKKLTTELYSLAEAVEIANQAAESYGKTIGKAANDSKLWTAASRLLSGTGLWKLQNYLRGAVQLVTFYNDAQAKAIEKSNEAMIATSKMNDKYKELGEVISKLKIKSNFDELVKTNLELKVTYEGLRNAGLSATKAQKEATKQVIGLYSNQYKKIGKMVDKHRSKTRKALKLDTAETKLAETQKLKARLISREKQIKEFEARRDQLEGVEGQGQIVTTLNRRIGALKGHQKRGKEKFGGEATIGRAFGKEMTNMVEGFKNFRKQYFTREKMKERFARLNAIRGLTFVKLGAKVGKVMGLALKFSLYFILFIMGAFIVFSIIRKIMENAQAMQVVIDTIQGVIESVMLILSGVFDLFGAFFGSGTFGERITLLITGIAKIFGGLIGILLEVAKFAVNMTMGLLFGLLKLVFWDLTLKHLFDLGVAIGNKIKDFFTGLPAKVQKHPLVKLVTKVLTFLGNQVAKIVNFVRDFKLPFMANGGVSSGGLTVVGERGPELVNLPKGARVHSNAESRKMTGGNTINVNVSGRVGSSDSELRDIAKKIGRMVNTEINRTTSSSTNVRY
tara:strand:+ start:483 stop:2177 length:1695 start_codon:yes stop_codon:yes gene_type:complete